MFTFETHGTQYRVYFKYSKKGHTTCIIKDTDAEEVTAKGKARLSKKDKFCRSYGRKVALKRAILKFTGSDPGLEELCPRTNDDFKTRRKIWDAYFAKSPKSKKK